ncbi:MAG: ORF6N domain-containing protein [Ruminococcus sp.]|nr:ORF6N domain-containing protein [Ruminococcus sp.]
MKAIEYKGQKVITTAMLAEAYETDTNNIRANFKRNKDKFVEGKHYFRLTGAELKEFKSNVTQSHAANSPANTLYLWTERGANHHCKILDTDKAWEQFENLEETYFRVKEAVTAFASPDGLKYLNGVANYLRVQRAIMKDKGCNPFEVAQMSRITCQTYGIPIPESLYAPKPYEQLAFEDVNKNQLRLGASEA